MKAILFINGIPPKQLPKLEHYSLVACTDGAFFYLEEKGFDWDLLTFISGDFDSFQPQQNELTEKIIHTPDQNKTDFQKALEILIEKGATEVDVFGGSGGEMDHFLGNITVAFKMKHRLEIRFFDEYSTYFFIPKHFVLNDVKDKMISLYPFPMAKNITTKGLNWSLNDEDLDICERIGTRNFAIENQVEIAYKLGDLVVFVGGEYQ